MTTRRGRTAYARGESDGRGATPIEPPTDIVKSNDALANSVIATTPNADHARYVRHVPIVKSVTDNGERIVFGVIMRPMAVDSQGDFAQADLIKKTAHDFVAGYGTRNELGIQHSEFAQPIELVESTIETIDHTKHGLEVKAGDWTGSVRVNDSEIWSKVEKAELTGFSIGGRGRKRAVDASTYLPIAKSVDGSENAAQNEITALDLDEFSLVDSPANEIRFVVAKRRSKSSEVAEDGSTKETTVKPTDNAETPTPAADKVADKPADGATASESPASQAAPAPALDIEAAIAKAMKPLQDKIAELEAARDAAEPIAKARRLTKGRLEALSNLHATLGAFIADATAEKADPEDDNSADEQIVLVNKGQKTEVAPATPAAPAIDIEAAIAKALKPVQDQLAEAQKELSIVKSVRMPPTNSNGSNPPTVIVKRKDDPALFDNLIRG